MVNYEQEISQDAVASGLIDLIAPGSLSVDGKPSEDTLANEWVSNNSKRWRFDHGILRWFEWDGARWQKDEVKAAFQSVRLHLRKAALGGNWSKGKSLPSIASASMVRGTESLCRGDERLAVKHDVWDPDPFLLGTPAGVIDLRDGRNTGPDRSAMITRSTSVAPIDQEPVRWLQFMHEITDGDTDLINFLQLALGYCLTGSTREHALFLAMVEAKTARACC